MFIRVLLPLPFDTPFDYAVPGDMAPGFLDYVRVPFGKRQMVGVVWENHPQGRPHKNLKPLLETIAFPPLSLLSHTFLPWVADYTLSPLGLMLKMALGGQKKFALPPLETQGNSEQCPLGGSQPGVYLSQDQKEAVTTIQQRWYPARLHPPHSPLPHSIHPFESEKGPENEKGPGVFLLDGVTGSGKTEVYFELIKTALNHGQQSLVLLPEIALSTQWIHRFQDRFGVMPTLWHSSLTPAQRQQHWTHIATGKARIIVGARSALFLPYKNLGLLVVDEEHDTAYKQEEKVIYNARDMAVVLGNLGKFPVILVSATPCLETLENCQKGKYISLPLSSRHGSATLPNVQLLDMRQQHQEKQSPFENRKKPNESSQSPLQAHAQETFSSTKARASSWLSPTLVCALEATLGRGEQALLFLNRRGYASVTLCGSCGERVSCPYCTACLVEHRSKNHLLCHHCGHSIKTPTTCVICGASGSLKACGPGVERLCEDVETLFPQYTYAMVTSDQSAHPKKLRETLQAFHDHKIDLLMGTQILAKGFHFPHLTLVGIVDADLGLSGTDLRASERTYQILHQVGGRAGREHKPGTVLVQTYQPHHPLFQALQAHDRESFTEQERTLRKTMGMPPYGRLAALIVSSANTKHLDQSLDLISRTRPSLDSIDIWGPAPAPLSLLRGKKRWRYLIKAPLGIKLQPLLRSWLGPLKFPHTVKVQIDIDPYSFL